MTKLRTPDSPQHAMLTIARRIGWPAAAKLVGRGERQVRRWSEPEHTASISLIDAARLDRAYLAAGGDFPPFEAWYCLQRALFAARAAHAMSLIGDRVADAARETGEALAARVLATMPGACEQMHRDADRETDEAILALALTRSAGTFGVPA